MNDFSAAYLTHYFVPDKIFGLVEKTTSDVPINGISNFFLDILEAAKPDYKDISASFHLIDEPRSIPSTNPDLSNLYAEVRVSVNFSPEILTEDRSHYLIELIENLRVSPLGVSALDQRLASVSLNWISGVADPVNIPTGGPGSQLVNFTGGYGQHNFDIPILNQAAWNDSVVVVIMDTPLPQIQPEQVQSWEPEARDLYAQVMAALDINHIKTNLSLPKTPNTDGSNDAVPKWVGQNDAGYHSLFIAGILKTIAPNAELYLIETLNTEGFGSIESFVEGLKILQTLRSSLGDRPIIVNFSGLFPWPPNLILSFLEDLIILNENGENELADQLSKAEWVTPTMRRIFKKWAQTPPTSSGLHELIEEIKQFSDYLLKYEELIIDLNDFGRDDAGSSENKPIMLAAAGNESGWRMKKALPRFTPSYPASIESIVGVGALKKNTLGQADYSNEADTPAQLGFWVFGGDTQSPKSVFNVPSPVDGVIGLSPESPSGWGEWSGTSFATAIFAAIVATVWSSGQPHPLTYIADQSPTVRFVQATQL